MRLYSGTSRQFITDTIQNQIADKLRAAFFANYFYNPSPGEINSWRNSLKAISIVFQHADLMDHGVILEYQLPLSSCRLDCLIAGRDSEKRDNAIIIELKQWEKCADADGENEVLTWLGGAEREVLHPSAQVGRYKMYLEDGHTAFYQGSSPVILNACTYLHNYNFCGGDVLLSKKFGFVLDKYPVFSADDVDPLRDYLVEKLERGEGIDVLRKIEGGQYRPSKKLMDHVANIIKGKPEFVLLDEQLVVYDKVIACAKKSFHDKKKTFIIIKGGPGTGKSVIAINLLADLLSKGYNAHYATGSRAFTGTLRKKIGSRGAIQFKYFNSYTDAEHDAVDVLVCDESHRLRKESHNRFTPKSKRSGLPQIQELLNASRVGVYFIDQDQVVRPDEVGSVSHIKDFAEKNDCNIYEYELEAQFRCSGSDAYVNWINNTLGIRRTANSIWSGEEAFDFRIFNSPEDLETEIRHKSTQGYSARMTAGFCWEWSKDLNADRTLKHDVIIGDFRRPWNARPEAARLAKGIPKATFWASDPGGINQIGCVYTAQGFEFDYVGVIIGNDLMYDLDKQKWEGFPENSGDTVVRRSKDKFLDLVKNTYRVLLSRGLKGCYVYFMDKDTERFFKSRMEPEVDGESRIEVEERPKLISWLNALPLFELRAVANSLYDSIDGYFSNEENYKLVKMDDGPFAEDRFLVKAEGNSMEPKIPDGSLCLFRKDPGGSRNGKIVLCRISGQSEGASLAVIKRYKSQQFLEPDGITIAKKIILSSTNPAHLPIEITETGEHTILGIFERVVE